MRPPPTEFAPGFRLSIRDALTLMAGAFAALYAGRTLPWLGFVIAFAVAHFFLFCNVFRIARVQELAWTVFFLVLAYFTATTGRPAWIVTVLLSLLATAAAVACELRKPSYHGVGWRKFNPQLRKWWDATHK